MPTPGDSGVTGALKRPAQGSNLKKSYKAADVRAMLAELKLRLMAGDTDEEARNWMDSPDRPISVARYNELKKELYRQEQADMSGKTAEDVFLEYKWSQQKCIKDLEDAMGEIPENQPNALVGAIRARSEIYDKILKVGQEIGIISKVPEKKVVIHGHVVAQLSNAELRKLIAQETNLLAGAVAMYGDTDMAGNPIDADDEPTFAPQEKTGLALAGPAKSAAARKSRQAVKRTKVIDVDPG